MLNNQHNALNCHKIIKSVFLFLISFRFQSVRGHKHIKALNIYLDKTNVFPVFGILDVIFNK